MTRWLHNLMIAGARLLRSQPWLRRTLYVPCERLFRPQFSTIEHLLYEGWKNKNVKESPPPVSEYTAAHPWTIGIIRDLFYNHESYIMACRELQVAYKTIDLFANDWVTQVERSGCDAFVAWPSESIQEWKRLYDERLYFLTTHMHRLLYPPYDALWLYGSKQRQRDWLDIHGFPHARTWVFYDETEAHGFLEQAQLPLVAKTDIGTSAHAVWILRTRRQAAGIVRRTFRCGLVGALADARARQWRHVLLQEYLLGVREWRIIRIGDNYFGHEKGKSGEFHSGSDVVGWFSPPRAALDLAHRITETGGFRSMAVDVFEQPDGSFLVNELQSVFGAIDTAQMYIEGVPGRYRRVDSQYVFEEGRFCRNACCNLRIDDLLGILAGASTISNHLSQPRRFA